MKILHKSFHRDIRETVVAPARDKSRLMRLNHFLANRYVLAVCCALIFLSIFFVANYLFNSIIRINLNDIIISQSNRSGEYFSVINAFRFPIARYFIFYLILLIVIAIVEARFIYLVRTGYKQYNVGQKGTARWTTLDEIKEQYKAVPLKSETYAGNGGVPISRYKDWFFIDDSAVNNLIIGITRSGKGETFVFPTVDIYSRAEKKPSLIISDPKLELYSSACDILIKRGYEVHVLNLVDPLHSMGFNPLQLIIDAYRSKDYAEAELLCNSFCYSIFNPDESEGDSQFWANTSVDLLSALILAHVDDCLKKDDAANAKGEFDIALRKKAFKELSKKNQAEVVRAISIITQYRESLTARPSEHEVIVKEIASNRKLSKNKVLSYLNSGMEIMYATPDQEYIPSHEFEKQITMYSIMNTFSELTRIQIDENHSALDVYFNQRPELDRAKMKFASVEGAGAKTRGSIYTNTRSKLTIFTYENIAKMTAESSLNLKDIGFGTKPIAIFLGMPDFDRSNHFIASVFIRQLYFVLSKTASQMPGQKCTREVVFLLDEFGNIPAIESMAQIITVCLGRNIRFNLIIQAYSQIEKLYGKDAETIVGNCGNQIYILTNDDETAQKFSGLIGSETITNLNRSGKKLKLEKDFTEMYEEHPLLNLNQLMELLEGEDVVKRVIKRQDLQHRKIRPTPIYNTGATALPFRYEYLLDDFPSDISFDDVNTESRAFINLRERRYDIQRAFFDMKNKEKGVVVSAEEANMARKITDLQNADSILPTLRHIFDSDQDCDQMSMEEAFILLDHAEREGRISKPERLGIIELFTQNDNIA